MTGINRTSKDFTKEERERLLEQYRGSGLDYVAFAREHNINPGTLKNWIWISERPKEYVHRIYSPVERKKTVETYLAIKDQQTVEEFSQAWGISGGTLSTWLARYEEFGADGLMSKPRKLNDKRLGMKVPLAVQGEIIKIKKAEPRFGIKRIAQNLFRFRGVRVSPNSVKKTITKEGLHLAKKPRKKKRSSEKVRRFERARPMQLWQSDITQYTLAVSSVRVYLTVFMDDHSRYVVGWRLASRQTSDLVMDAFKDACARFGKPEEVLTDQGRQYFAWRGKSDLEKYLEKEGIKHVVSRAHHPQTLGKCERFWETIGNELWTRAKPQDLEEARMRLKHFIDYYNHQRPHQGIGGSVPADRFFGVASEVKALIEKTVARNAHQMSIGELPEAPAFLIGQVGDQKVAFHGRSGSFYLTHESGEKSESGTGAVARATTSGAEEDCIASNEKAKTVGSKTGENQLSACASVVVEGECGGANAGASIGECHDGILDGDYEQSGSRGETRSEADSFLATGKPSDDGDDRGVTASAEASGEGSHPSGGGE